MPHNFVTQSNLAANATPTCSTVARIVRWVTVTVALLAIAGCGSAQMQRRTVGGPNGGWDWGMSCVPRDPQVRQFGRLLAPHTLQHVEGSTKVLWHAQGGDVFLSAPVHNRWGDSDGAFLNQSYSPVTVSAHC